MELTEAIDDNVHQKPTMVTLWEELPQSFSARETISAKEIATHQAKNHHPFWVCLAFLQLKECVSAAHLFIFWD